MHDREVASALRAFRISQLVARSIPIALLAIAGPFIVLSAFKPESDKAGWFALVVAYTGLAGQIMLSVTSIKRAAGLLTRPGAQADLASLCALLAAKGWRPRSVRRRIEVSLATRISESSPAEQAELTSEQIIALADSLRNGCDEYLRATLVVLGNVASPAVLPQVRRLSRAALHSKVRPDIVALATQSIEKIERRTLLAADELTLCRPSGPSQQRSAELLRAPVVLSSDAPLKSQTGITQTD